MGVSIERFAPRHLRTWPADAGEWLTVDGTLVFVDISGFTALSERLAARGRVGAEELTEVLGRVFGEMIDLASRRGGTLLKFGGDALLLLFESNDHAEQGANAAVEMRTALREAANIPTSVGRVRLRMSQGIHSGDVHLFRAEGTHTELIVAGPAASTVAEMEGVADANEIVVSASTRARLPDDAAEAAKGNGFLLRWRSADLPACGYVGMDAGGRSDGSLIPAGLREQLTSGVVDPEHRRATVAFIELLGLDESIETGGGPATADELRHAIATITSIADAEDVTFLATDVDTSACKVILVAGVPATKVDEEGRMLRTVRRIADAGIRLPMKIGVNNGHVFSGVIGTEHRATYTIMGDTVNVAARMMAAAPEGAIYVAPSVVEASRTLFETAEVEPFHVKGKTEPIRVFDLGDETGSRTSVLTSGPFVGRDAEVETIRSAIRALASGSGASITVHGPTGIGKTRLVQESLAGSETVRIEIRAEPYGSANPYRSARDAVRGLLGIERGPNEEMASVLERAVSSVAPRLVPLAPLIGDVAHVDVPPTEETAIIDGRFRQERTADVIIELFDAVLDGPAVVVAEDMHWADAATVHLVGRLAAATPDHPWLLVATTHDMGTGEGGETIDLGGLEPDAIRRLIHEMTEAAPLRPDVVDAVIARAGGSPLFTEELVKIVRETGEITSLPTSLDGVVGSQIDALEPLPRAVLRYVSVLGRSFRTSVARDLIASQDAELDQATRTRLDGFLVADGRDRMQFRHALVRDTAYEGLSFRKRKALHLAAGELVLANAPDDGESVADILSMHFALGGDPSRAWRYSLTAGDHSMAMFANVEAAAQYQRAIDAARSLDVADHERASVLVRFGDVQERSGDFSASLDAYKRAARLASDDPVEHARVILRRARAKERAGSYSAALADTTRAKVLLAGDDTTDAAVLRANALGYAALIRQAQQKPQEALAAAEEAARAAEEVGDEVSLARAWRVMDFAFAMLGRLDEAVHSEDALAIYEREGDLAEAAGVSANLGAFAYWRGDWESAIAYYEGGRSALHRVGNMVDAANAAANLGEVLVNQGRYGDALEPLTEARRVWRASGFLDGVVFADVLLGRMYGIRDDLERSEAALREAISGAAELGADGFSFEAALHLADARCRSGHPDEGLSLLAEAGDAVSPEYGDYYALLFSRIRGSILASAGRLDEAVICLDEGIAMAEARGEVYDHALLVLTLARVEPSRVSPERAAEARAALTALGVVSVPGIDLVDQRSPVSAP